MLFFPSEVLLQLSSKSFSLSDIMLPIIEISLQSLYRQPNIVLLDKFYLQHNKLSYGIGNACNLCVWHLKLKQVLVTLARSN